MNDAETVVRQAPTAVIRTTLQWGRAMNDAETRYNARWYHDDILLQ